jgi:hypothetical protein
MQQLTTGFERMRHTIFSPDGNWISIQPSHRNIYYCCRSNGGSSLWMMTLGGSPAPAAVPTP